MVSLGTRSSPSTTFVTPTVYLLDPIAIARPSAMVRSVPFPAFEAGSEGTV